MPEYLYIHIPFCAQKCAYCDFLSVPFDEQLALQYTDALCRELELKQSHAEELRTVFIGGGTPSILPEACLERMFRCLKDNYRISASAEITVEANPGTLSRAKADLLLLLGVNRLSLGIQSFADGELKTLGRIHNSEEALQSAKMLRSAGLENLSLDLIYGVPGQTMKTWERTLETTISLSPKHVSAYELTPEKNTPLMGLLESGRLAMPDEELVLDLNACAADSLAAAGYERYEISNYAMPGYRCIHNLNYWNRGEYLAAGAGAHSFVKGIRSVNTGNIRKYISMLGSGLVPEVESNEISCEEALREFIFLGLRKTDGLLLNDADELGLNVAEAGRELFSKGLAELTGTHLRITGKGLPVANTVIVKLLENLGL